MMKGIRHGTHTWSIAAGNYVQVANVTGHWSLVNVAAGIVPSAHLAIYKACSGGGCQQSSILAAIDAAIEDGIDVISISLGGAPLRSFSNDVLAALLFEPFNMGSS